jgi:hypothetical protein
MKWGMHAVYLCMANELLALVHVEMRFSAGATVVGGGSGIILCD